MRHLLNKHILIVNGHNFGEFGLGDHWGYAVFRQGTTSGRLGASCDVLTTTIGQRASILQCLYRPIEIALGFW